MKFENLDLTEILEKISEYASSESASHLIKTLEPQGSAELALDSVEQIKKCISIIEHGHRPPMESIDIFSTWAKRLGQEANLKIMELKDVRHFCNDFLSLRDAIGEVEDDWAQSEAKSLFNTEEPLSAINQIITLGGEIRTDASETLYKLYNEKQALIVRVQKVLTKTVKAFEMETVLQDRFVTNREGRWVLPVKSGMQHQFDGIIHAQSHSKQTVFMEPNEIIPANNKLQIIESQIQEEIESLLKNLSIYLSSHLSEFLQSKEILLTYDQFLAKAQFCLRVHGQEFAFSEKNIRLIQVTHPLLVMNEEKVIANSVELTETSRILLLSGPNAGGKTVLLKSVGLAMQMARCGLMICAEAGSELPYIEEFHIAIGDQQSVGEHLSTFAAHLQILNKAAFASGFNKMILIDEICGSTDPEEGTALARSFIKRYAENNIFVVVTSHLGPLKLGWKKDSGVINGSLEFDKLKGRPTYQFLMGVPGNSLAIQTAKRVGVDTEIVENALEFLSPDSKKYVNILDEVEKTKEQLLKLRNELLEEKSQFHNEKNKYEKLLSSLNLQRDEYVYQQSKEAIEEIEKNIQSSKVVDVFKKHEIAETMKKDFPKVVKNGQTNKKREILTLEDFKKYCPPGTKVFIPSLNRDGIVHSEPNGKGEIFVLSNSIRISILWNQVEFSAAPAPAKKSVSGQGSLSLGDGD